MYRSGQMELDSNGWVQSRIGDRPSFEAAVTRGLLSHTYYVFLMEQGFLFLDKRTHAGADRDASHNAMLAGMAIGGLVGGLVGSAIGTALSRPMEEKENFDLVPNEQLLILARARKKSFVSMSSEVRSVSIDAPGTFGRIFGSNVAGFITVHDSKLGKIKIDVKEQAALSAVVDAAPRRFGDRAVVNVRWDDTKRRFVPK